MWLPATDALANLALLADEAAIHLDLAGMWTSLGPFAKLVAVVLAVMSAWSLGVMAERLVTYSRARRASRDYAEQLRELLPAGKHAEAIELARKLSRGHLSRVLGLAIEEYHRGVQAVRHRGPHDLGDLDVIAAVNRAVDRSSLRTLADLRRGLGGLATVSFTAPYVGLLGTVAGIITAFQSMATGSAGLGSVSAGIAEALLTTALGLLVAIPSAMMFNYLSNRVEDMQVDIADSANELLDFFLKEGRPEPPSGELGA